MEKAATAKDDLRLDVAEPLAVAGGDPRASTASAASTGRLTFFGRRRSLGGSENTWVVSLVLVAHLVAFFATMFVNDCPATSASGCALRPLGRFSFQPLSENPLLGPSSSTLIKMGALQRTLAILQNEKWRLLTSPWLHSGVIHVFVDLLGIILIGVHLERDFGPLRTGVIYLLSAFQGSMASAMFVQHSPAVGSSGALFGFIGATLSGLIQNWQIYADKLTAIAVLAFVASLNLSVGLLPYVDNFANIGGFFSGILLGFTLLFNPQLQQLERKKGLFDYGSSSHVNLRQKLDKPAVRIVALIFFSITIAGGLLGIFHGVNANDYCGWCYYIDCVPTKFNCGAAT